MLIPSKQINTANDPAINRACLRNVPLQIFIKKRQVKPPPAPNTMFTLTQEIRAVQSVPTEINSEAIGEYFTSDREPAPANTERSCRGSQCCLHNIALSCKISGRVRRYPKPFSHPLLQPHNPPPTPDFHTYPGEPALHCLESESRAWVDGGGRH